MPHVGEAACIGQNLVQISHAKSQSTPMAQDAATSGAIDDIIHIRGRTEEAKENEIACVSCTQMGHHVPQQGARNV